MREHTTTDVPSATDTGRSDTSEDEYQEISLSPDTEDIKPTQPRKESSESSAKSDLANLHRPVATQSQHCSDSDEEYWTSSKGRSTSCFANIWPQKRLLSIEGLSVHRRPDTESDRTGSASSKGISLRRTNTTPAEQNFHSSSPGNQHNTGSDIGDVSVLDDFSGLNSLTAI